MSMHAFLCEVIAEGYDIHFDHDSNSTSVSCIIRRGHWSASPTHIDNRVFTDEDLLVHELRNIFLHVRFDYDRSHPVTV